MSFQMSGDLQGIIDWLDDVEARVLDLSPLTESIRIIMVDRNRAMRLAGLGADGTPLAPLRGGRPLTDREIRRRGGNGPPLAPKGEDSRSIADFEVRVDRLSDGEVLLTPSWPTFSLVIAIHAVGTSRLPRRDIVDQGLNPSAVIDAVRDFAADVIRRD